MDAMPADVAEASGNPALVDNSGTIWVERDNRWAYITGGGLTMWDARDRLPPQYEPYQALDREAYEFINRHA
ncbi:MULTISPECIES: hypothetical protein [Mycolicibacter]|uniref:Uncharacterized protein n=2 Tax=Mycolicibacter TaxID=1073531 RepID=A0ABU5XKU6_9MYCO|nr:MULTISPECIES: hypothetical protein [unclassified Mycolicibacter]MEB3022910.1 hypothetical protein [Mycolicibacter sp. MYC098]MEB3034995.1 hypothetical protein [Mycolicibacter sp. MYC340]